MPAFRSATVASATVASAAVASAAVASAAALARYALRLAAVPSSAAVILLVACASGGQSNAAGISPAPATADRGAPYVRMPCPLPGGSVGYPVAVSVAPGSNGAAIDSSWLDEWARAAALRWPVPSRRRSRMPEYRTLTDRVLPDAPRWADDWFPTARHRAEARVTVRRDGPMTFALVRGSGDGVFDGSLAGIVDDPLPASPAFPPLPSHAPDSVRLTMRFGVEPGDSVPVGVARFARQQRPARIVPGTLLVYGTQSDRAVVAYVVEVDGEVDPASIAVLSASSPQVGDAVREGLLRARFMPAEGDCEQIPLTVIQQYGR